MNPHLILERKVVFLSVSQESSKRMFIDTHRIWTWKFTRKKEFQEHFVLKNSSEGYTWEFNEHRLSKSKAQHLSLEKCSDKKLQQDYRRATETDVLSVLRLLIDCLWPEMCSAAKRIFSNLCKMISPEIRETQKCPKRANINSTKFTVAWLVLWLSSLSDVNDRTS